MKCDYCRTKLFDTDRRCPNCGGEIPDKKEIPIIIKDEELDDSGKGSDTEEKSIERVYEDWKPYKKYKRTWKGIYTDKGRRRYTKRYSRMKKSDKSIFELLESVKDKKPKENKEISFGPFAYVIIAVSLFLMIFIPFNLIVLTEDIYAFYGLTFLVGFMLSLWFYTGSERNGKIH